MKRTKTFWKAFGVTMLLALAGLLIITAPAHPECATVPEDVGSCNMMVRITNLAPAVFLVAVPMSIFVGLIAEGMQPKNDTPKKKKKKSDGA